MQEHVPASVVALRRHLAQALRRGTFEEADSILERLEREDPLSVHTRGGRFELLVRSGRLDDARRLEPLLLEAFPASARVHYLAGRLAYRQRDYLGAIDRFEESRRVRRHWRTDHWLGKALTQAGRLTDAEPLLESLVSERAHVGRDLAWLYERMGDDRRALEALETYCERYPDDDFGRQQLQRLRARTLDPDRLQKEVETLLELGEPLPTEVFPEYVEHLLRSGQAARAREVVAAHSDELDALAATRTAWICHRLQAPDLACALFLRTMDRNLHSPKYRTVLERDAVRAGCVDDVVEALRQRVADHTHLWGMIKRLERSL